MSKKLQEEATLSRHATCQTSGTQSLSSIHPGLESNVREQYTPSIIPAQVN